MIQPRFLCAGGDGFAGMSWEDALDKIARVLKGDRDADVVRENISAVTMNRWTTVGFPAASSWTRKAHRAVLHAA